MVPRGERRARNALNAERRHVYPVLYLIIRYQLMIHAFLGLKA